MPPAVNTTWYQNCPLHFRQRFILFNLLYRYDRHKLPDRYINTVLLVVMAWPPSWPFDCRLFVGVTPGRCELTSFATRIGGAIFANRHDYRDLELAELAER